MKIKQFISVILVTSVIQISCRKSVFVETENCLSQIEKVSETLNTYVQDPTESNCKAYLDALRFYINSNACFGNVFFEEYRRQLKEAEEDECK